MFSSRVRGGAAAGGGGGYPDPSISSRSISISIQRSSAAASSARLRRLPPRFPQIASDRAHTAASSASSVCSAAISACSRAICAGKSFSACWSLKLSRRFAGRRRRLRPRRLHLRSALTAAFACTPSPRCAHHVGVAAGIFDKPPVALRHHDRGHDPVEKIAVVADQKDGAGIVRDHFLQQIERFEIEVVGRLVEHQEGWTASPASWRAAAARARRRTARAPACAPARREQEILHVAHDVPRLAGDRDVVAAPAGQHIAQGCLRGSGSRAPDRASR